MEYEDFLEYVDEIEEYQENIKELVEHMKEPLSFVDARGYKFKTERDIQHYRNEIVNLCAQLMDKADLPLNRPIACGAGRTITFTGGMMQNPVYASVEHI